jgi:alkylated DNA repair dioxygenase AlkB
MFPLFGDRKRKTETAPPTTRVVRHADGSEWRRTYLSSAAVTGPTVPSLPVSYVDTGILPTERRLDGPAFEHLWALRPPELGEVIIMGERLRTPRWQCSYNAGYFFSGLYHPGEPLPEILAPYLRWANGLGLGEFNQVWVNWYQNGLHYIAKHRDGEPRMRPMSPIVSVSFGATRILRLRAWPGGAMVRDVPMSDHSALIMGGAIQRTHTHEVVRVSGRTGAALGRRINVTFRQFDLDADVPPPPPPPRASWMRRGNKSREEEEEETDADCATAKRRRITYSH